MHTKGRSSNLFLETILKSELAELPFRKILQKTMEKQWVLSVRHTLPHILDTVGIKVSDEKIIML